MSSFMATHSSETLFKPTASALGSASRSKACKRHERASPTTPTVANCCKLQVKTITKPTTSVVVAICITSRPTFFCGIDHDETPPGVLLRFYSRLWHTTLTDAGTNLVQTHRPGLGCRNFRCGRREFNFHLQNKSTTWWLLALRISLSHLHHIACEFVLMHVKSFPVCPFLFVQLERWVDDWW